jgi:hypothetical protein
LRRAAVGLPVVGKHDVAHAEVAEGVLDVAAIGGHRPWRAPGPLFDPLDGGFEHWDRRPGLPVSTNWSTITPSSLSINRALVVRRR